MWWHCILRTDGMNLEEHSDLHCIVSFPDQEAPALEKTMGRGYGETVHGLVVVSVVVELVFEWKLLFVLVIAWHGPQANGSRFRLVVLVRCGWLDRRVDSSPRWSVVVWAHPWPSSLWAVVLLRTVYTTIQRIAPFISYRYVCALPCPMVQVS